MPDLNQFDPSKIATGLGVLSAIAAIIMWPFKFFLPRKTAEAVYVKKVEPDGTRLYVHSVEWQDMKRTMEDSVSESKKWRELAEKWINKP